MFFIAWLRGLQRACLAAQSPRFGWCSVSSHERRRERGNFARAGMHTGQLCKPSDL